MLKLLKRLQAIEVVQVLISLVFIVIQVWLDLKLPDYMSDITRLVQTEGSKMSEIWEQGGYMLLCALGSLVSAVIVGFFGARIAASFSKRLRSLLYDKVESFSMEEINQFSTSSLITRSSNDITQVQMIIAMGLQVMLKAPILAVWAILKISGKEWEWSLTTCCSVLFLLAMIAVLVLVAMPKFKVIQQLTDNLNRVTHENLTGVRVVRAYNAEAYQEAKFETANEALTATHLFTGRVMSIMMPGMTMIMSGLSLAIYWIGAYLIDAAGLMDRVGLFSDMVVYSSYAIQVVMAFMMMTMIFILLPRASVAAKRINEVLLTKPRILDGTHDENTEKHGEIIFDHVNFRYPDAAEDILHDISFSVAQGETVAFIGSTGSGKSTLLNLIPRFFDATEGAISIDGIDIKAYTQEALHNKLGYVPQRAVMFAGSVKSNIAFGENGKPAPTNEEIRKAVAIAQGTEFVEQMEGQYDASIAQSGTNISGGQKQRLAIARAVCRKPEIFLFDDSFSALDYKTDRTLRSVLKRETSGATTLIVAQRIGTIQDADKIIVLDEGAIVGIGTHRELLKSCAVYQEIAYSQLSKEELGDE